MYINGGFFGGGAFILQYLFFFVGVFFSLLVFVGFVCWGGGVVFFRPTKSNSTKPILFQIDKKRTNQYYKGVLNISSQHQRVS